jgi:class 3 adenylate cyclase
VEIPDTRYARSGDVNIAYQVFGGGPLDLVFVPGWVSHVEEAWEYPSFAAFLRRLGTFARVITFDKRGTGLSDAVPIDRLPTLEQRMDDVRAVMDAAASPRAAVFGVWEWSEDYPWAPRPEARAREIESVEREWARLDVTAIAPSASPDERTRLARLLRRSASPGAAAALLRMNTQIDVRNVLPTIRVPTLVLHRSRDRDVNVEEGRWIASQIPGARYVELDGDDHVPWLGDVESLVGEIEEFLTGARPVAHPDRVLATVLFTDVVGSTETAVRIGDDRWRSVMERHHAIVRGELRRHRGVEIDNVGDGFLARFDGPARAIRCASSIVDAVRDAVGLDVRAGIHTGECELLGDKVTGVAVHTGARVAAHARAGEVVVSSTVRDLVAGSGIEFRNRGAVELKGLPGEWQLWSVEP